MNWANVARRQGGVIARSQLRGAGYSKPVIDSLIRRGALQQTGARAVYRAAGAPQSPEMARWLAALRTESPLSYLTAAELWDIASYPDPRLHITRFDRRRLDWPPGVRVHRVLLATEAVTERYGLTVTTRRETLLDCLGWLPIGDARTLADRAKQQQWLGVADVERRLDNQPGRWGNKRLRLLLPNLSDGAHSEAERRLHRLMRTAGITGWQPNLVVDVAGASYVLDVAFEGPRIAIEVDGYRHHSSAEAFQGDRTKATRLTAAGWLVVRFTWSDIVDRPDYVIATILSLLAAQ